MYYNFTLLMAEWSVLVLVLVVTPVPTEDSSNPRM